MTPVYRAGPALARRVFLCAFFLSVTTAYTKADASDPRSIAVDNLVEVLDAWLDGHSEHPRRDKQPVIRFLKKPFSVTGTNAASIGSTRKTRGFYSEYSETIWLVEPWSADNPVDVSVLLHELVHHRQAGDGHWYCPSAQELPAYRLQQEWLDGYGLKLNVNWVEIVLKSGCTPRDIHP